MVLLGYGPFSGFVAVDVRCFDKSLYRFDSFLVYILSRTPRIVEFLAFKFFYPRHRLTTFPFPTPSLCFFLPLHREIVAFFNLMATSSSQSSEVDWKLCKWAPVCLQLIHRL